MSYRGVQFFLVYQWFFRLSRSRGSFPRRRMIQNRFSILFCAIDDARLDIDILKVSANSNDSSFLGLATGF
ncbi:hypothetical protein AYI68_g1255 [Smittium mucronatum]|uniref:Uncharacterized protein n=1 Tax=Smittium mucronatum TaxID=133383 RepID=A0A1R0H613_9FUNG|nr:hypothetical protein AYI68_g1255 [Smittium mucronatum]